MHNPLVGGSSPSGPTCVALCSPGKSRRTGFCLLGFAYHYLLRCSAESTERLATIDLGQVDVRRSRFLRFDMRMRRNRSKVSKHQAKCVAVKSDVFDACFRRTFIRVLDIVTVLNDRSPVLFIQSLSLDWVHKQGNRHHKYSSIPHERVINVTHSLVA